MDAWLLHNFKKVKPTADNYIEKDGEMFVKKTIAAGLNGFSFSAQPITGLFRCMEMSGNDFFKLTLIGGLFGLHKFATKNYLHGLGYLLSCGMCGVFYVIDLIEILNGNYSYYATHYDEDDTGNMNRTKERIFCRKMDNLLLGAVGTFIGTLAAYIIVKYGYMRVLSGFSETLSKIVISMTREG